MQPTKNGDYLAIRGLLEGSYIEATNRLIEFTANVRGLKNNNQGKYSVKFRDLDQLFDKNLWIEHKTSSGHRKLENKVTGVITGYSKHGNLDPGAVQDILEDVQEHLNILHNEIFRFKPRGWTVCPNFDKAVVSFLEWEKSNFKRI